MRYWTTTLLRPLTPPQKIGNSLGRMVGLDQAWASDGVLSLRQWRRSGRPLPSRVGGEWVALDRSRGELVVRGQSGEERFPLLSSALLPKGLVEGDKVVLTLEVSGCVEEVRVAAGNQRGRSERIAEPRYTMHEAEEWSRFVDEVRGWFLDQGLTQVQTPSLVVCPGTEPNLEPFATEYKFGSLRKRLFLPTSPELSLKKLIADGWTDIFEIRSCFRNEEQSPLHRSEFTMLEWYRAWQPFSQLEVDLLALVDHLARSGLVRGEVAEAERWTVQSLFEHCCGVTITPLTQAKDLGGQGEETLTDVLTRLWVDQIEPWLATRPGPILVSHFHPDQAALAKLDDAGWAERLELYWRGLEIANGFNELTDPIEQERRMVWDVRERARLGRTPVPVDQDFLEALKRGLPPTVGMAMGLERLLMACRGGGAGSESRIFPHSVRVDW